MLDRDLDSYQEMKEMVRCVQLHFRHQKQQREIAEQLGISPSKVSRLLKRAYQEGIVRVHITLPPMPRLATALMEQYGLRDAVVIPSGQASDIKEELGIATARYFEKIAGDGVKVGLSCGYTLYCMIKHLREGLIKDLKIYPLSAESTLRLVDLFPNTLVGMMAAKYRPDVTAYALHAQLIGPLEEIDRERQLLLESTRDSQDLRRGPRGRCRHGRDWRGRTRNARVLQHCRALWGVAAEIDGHEGSGRDQLPTIRWPRDIWCDRTSLRASPNEWSRWRPSICGT